MLIAIRNFRGIASADLNVSGVTLITGPNYAGKTSILQAAAAAMTGSPIPISGLTKAQGGLLVRAGNAGGEITVDTGIGISKITYPGAQHTSEGAPAVISDDAAGMHSFVDDPQSVRASVVSTLLHAQPTEEQLSAALQTLGANEKGIRRVWDTINSQGWDSAHEVAKQTGQRLKGAWDNETGQRYGSKKGESWTPAEWTEDLRDSTEESLAASVKQETEWLEAAISHRAVSDAELSRLTQDAAKLAGLQEDDKRLSDTVAGLIKTQQQIESGKASLPPDTKQAGVPCPYCGKPVIISGQKLSAPEEITAAVIATRQAAIEECNKALADLKPELDKQEAELAQIRIAIAGAKIAADKLAMAKQPTGDSAPVDEVRARLTRAQSRLTAYQKYHKAADLHKQIGRNQDIIDILSPDGLRMTTLRTALTKINSRMAELSKIAGWRSVEIKSDLSVTYGGSLYILLSESEQYRVRVIMQIAFAELSQSHTLLIDRADVLDSAGRNELIRLLTSIGKAALVGMTIYKKADCPDMGKVGGKAYWIENGNSNEIVPI